MIEQVFGAVDLGASGGRVLAVTFDGQRVRLEEVHRFENVAVNLVGHLHWDVLGLWKHVQDGLRSLGAKYPKSVKSVGVDTWGVDFALLGRDDILLGNPYSYRDRRTEGVMEATLARVSREEIFAATGLQFMPINTLYQLAAMQKQASPLLEAAETFLMMPDFLHWLLTGEKTNEVTNATTTQFFNPTTGDWARDLLAKLDLPTDLFARLIQPGTNLGALQSEVATSTGLKGVSVIAPGTHDTASAVMAVPAEQDGAGLDWCYVSSGTWCLMGVEVARPITTDRCRQWNFTNEGGVGGTTRLLKNITGLWLVQECRRTWSEAGRDYSWTALAQMAAKSPRLQSLVDPDDSTFQAPTDMPEAIRAYCRRTGQNVPEDEGAVIRAAIEGIALKSRYVLERLEQLVGRRLATIHVVGGGSQNEELCQATADACRRVVLAGPVEATALGNAMTQAIAAGALGSIREARQCIRASFPLHRYEPDTSDAWDAAYAKFQRLLEEPKGRA